MKEPNEATKRSATQHLQHLQSRIAMEYDHDSAEESYTEEYSDVDPNQDQNNNNNNHHHHDKHTEMIEPLPTAQELGMSLEKEGKTNKNGKDDHNGDDDKNNHDLSMQVQVKSFRACKMPDSSSENSFCVLM